MDTKTQEIMNPIIDRLQTQLERAMALVEAQMGIIEKYQKTPHPDVSPHDLAWTPSNLANAQGSIVQSIQEALGDHLNFHRRTGDS